MVSPQGRQLRPIAAVGDDDLRTLLTIRHFERLLLRLFDEGKLHGTTHTCLGQEYIPVALSPLLEPDDFQISNHRGHGHYLARFGDLAGLLAEIMGREGGIANGVGGSQHLYRDRQFLSTGIQGESAAVGAGVALHFKRSGSAQIAVVHTGDGSWGEGALYEALNMASLWQLPLVLVVEHNGIAQTTPSAMQMAGTIADRARGFGVRHVWTDSVDLEEIRALLAPEIARARSAPAPLVVEFETFRLGPHSKGDDTRESAELEAIAAWDWHARYRDAFPEQVARLELEVDRELARIHQDVDGRAPSRWPDAPGECSR